MNRTIASLSVGVICTISALGVAFLLSNASSHSEFVSKALWDEFVLETGAKPYSKANSSDIATGFSMADAQSFLFWINAKERATYRLMTLDEFRNASANNTLPDAVKSVKTWLSDCFDDESFHTPSDEDKSIWGLSHNWLGKINKNGEVCTGNKCLSCKVAWINGGLVQDQVMFSERSPNNVGLILVAQE